MILEHRDELAPGDCVYNNGKTSLVVCRHCHRLRRAHANDNCLFDSTTWEPTTDPIRGMDEPLALTLHDCNAENQHALFSPTDTESA